MADDGELQLLAERLAELILKGLGARSAWALDTALRAGDTDGIAGVCVMKIPAKDSGRVEITFTVGTVDVVSRWGDSA